jgi:hypothetical protein
MSCIIRAADISVISIGYRQDVTPCSPVEVNWRLGGTCCYHHQSPRYKPRNKPGRIINSWCLLSLSWRWTQFFPPKRPWASTLLHGFNNNFCFAQSSTLKMEAIHCSETSVSHLIIAGCLLSLLFNPENWGSTLPRNVCELRCQNQLFLVACLAYSSTLKLEAICSSEISVNYQTKRHHISECSTLRSFCC